MSVPTKMKQWVVEGTGKEFETLKCVEAEVPKVGENEVLVKLRAASLNYRDLIIPRGMYPFPTDFPVVPGSDGAGDVVAVGSKVTKWKKGDRVVTLFNQGHQYGAVDLQSANSGLGGVIDGTLRQYGVFNETGLVRAPKNLSYAEAATLTCAGLTSWNALYGLKSLKPGETVLVQGTGGVSIFALQFAKAAGATVIATTSSKEKEETLKKLGADYVLNYKEDTNWGETAKKLSGGEGVDHIIEVGGADTLRNSLKAIKFEGIISIIGFLGGAKVDSTIIECLTNICTARGIYVGSRQQMEEMVAAIEANDIHPVVDSKTFSLEQTNEAYQFQWDKGHVGKVAININ
ncbi:hypothetical protein F5Y17DRAFT_258999 [Xylariaceae sp. FL0594]|nr:hypothetical protein F5Y17DRAFT_258999 [Xylariaceae sp. FL0594]